MELLILIPWVNSLNEKNVTNLNLIYSERENVINLWNASDADECQKVF